MRSSMVGGALIGALCLVVVASCTRDDPEANPAVRPNILIVVTDDQRANLFATMPRTRDWFMDGGTVFTQAFATTPQCCPSRASILTGRYAHNHGVRTNYDADQLDEDFTIQAYLGDAGYRTAIVGKYLNRIGPYKDRENTSIDPSHFDDWATFLGGYQDTLFNINGKLVPAGKYSTDFIADRAIQLLDEFEEDDEQPWLLYVAPFAPHAPFEPSPAYKGAPVSFYEGNPAIARGAPRLDGDQPEFLVRRAVSLSDARTMRRKQLRMLMSVDDLVQSISEALEKLNEDRYTFAIFMSDNGVQWGEKGLVGKGYPYQQSVHVPLIVRWPGHIPAGETDDRIVANVDIAPTLLDVAGISARTEYPFDGRSLVDNTSRKELLLEFAGLRELGISPWAALMTGSDIYVEYYKDGTRRILFKEFYDFDRDPYELRNLAELKGFEARGRLLSKKLDSLRKCSGSDCP